MKIIEIHIKNMKCELPSELPDDVTSQAFSKIREILEKHRIKCDIDYKLILQGVPKMINVDCDFNIKEDL